MSGIGLLGEENVVLPRITLTGNAVIMKYHRYHLPSPLNSAKGNPEYDEVAAGKLSSVPCQIGFGARLGIGPFDSFLSFRPLDPYKYIREQRVSAD